MIQTFTVRILKYLNLCFSWMAPRKKNEIVEESYHTPILC